jgi:hypothetical protein
MTYAELVSQLSQLPLDSDEYKEVKRKIQELDFAMDMDTEFGKIEELD